MLRSDDEVLSGLAQLCAEFNAGHLRGVARLVHNYENQLKGSRFWKPYVVVRTRLWAAGGLKHRYSAKLGSMRENGLPMPDEELVEAQVVQLRLSKAEKIAEKDSTESCIRLYPRAVFHEPEQPLSADEIFDWVMRNAAIEEASPSDAPGVAAWGVLQRFRMSPDLYDRMLEKWLNRKSEDERRRREEQVSGLGSRTGRPGVADDGMTLDKLLTTARSRK